MTNRKSTKRALLLSVCSIMLCLVMLIGTTFAWFTDTASTAVNKIQAGTLKVKLEYATAWDAETREPTAWADAEGQTLNFRTADGRTTDILWEPGCRYQLPELRVVNDGNLALKYRVAITGIQGSAKLNEVIDWTIKNDADTEATDLSTTEYHLTAKGTDGASDVITIMGTMQTTAGNEYQNESIDGISITVYATQDTVEHDSFGNQYDANAAYYPVIDAAGLKDALTNGGNVTLANDVAVAPEVDTTVESYKLFAQMTVSKDTTLDLSGKKIAFDVAAGTDYAKACPLLMAVTGGTLTINGDGEINCDAAAGNNAYGINVNGGNVVINGGKYYGAITAIQVQKGSLEINGGFFDMTDDCKTTVPQYAKYIVNCIDAAYRDGTARISIKGGTFVNFDPSADPEGAGTTYVADGYSVISETQANGEVWYTVVEGNVTTLTPETVNHSGIYHSNGTYYLAAGSYGEFTATLEQSYKNVTFLASENATFEAVTIRYHGGTPSAEAISAKGDSTLTVKGFRVNGGISINSFDKNVIVEENTAASITLKTNHVADMDVRFRNNALGTGTASNGYGIYFVPNTTNYDLTITGNSFTGTKSHAIAVQGCGDGSAVTAAKTITVKGNAFRSYGLNGKAGRAAFKIWEDTKLAPSSEAALSTEAETLIGSVKANNTFGAELGANCVAGDFFDTIVALN